MAFLNLIIESPLQDLQCALSLSLLLDFLGIGNNRFVTLANI